MEQNNQWLECPFFFSPFLFSFFFSTVARCHARRHPGERTWPGGPRTSRLLGHTRPSRLWRWCPRLALRRRHPRLSPTVRTPCSAMVPRAPAPSPHRPRITLFGGKSEMLGPMVAGETKINYFFQLSLSTSPCESIEKEFHLWSCFEKAHTSSWRCWESCAVARVPCSAGRFTFHRLSSLGSTTDAFRHIRMQRRVDLLEFIGSPLLVCADHDSGHKIYLHAMK
jgi:hypothetical protein